MGEGPFDDRWAAVLPSETGKQGVGVPRKQNAESGLVELPDLAEDMTKFAEKAVPKPGDKGTRTAQVLEEIAKEVATKKAGEDSWAA